MEQVTNEMIGDALDALRSSYDVSPTLLAREIKVNRIISSGHLDFDLVAINKYASFFHIPVSSIMFIAEHLESARQGVLKKSLCPHATRILDIERAMQELHRAKLAKAELKKDEEQ